ncbi:38971_t:CDS:10, partial [Gigaspora margarita]
PISNQFLDLFDAITLEQYDNREVKVFIRKKKSKGWQEVDNGLSDTLDSTQDGPNAFSILIVNSRLPLLPQSCTEYNSYNRLYYEIIELFQAQKVGWMNSLHEPIGKIFVTHLASTLWYIDPHLITMHAPSNNIWNQVMPTILSLIETLKKYSDYLNSIAISMNELYHSNESARSPENNSTMYQVSIWVTVIMLEEKSIKPNSTSMRISETEISNGRQDETSKARMLARIHEELPHYFTRQMQKNVLDKQILILYSIYEQTMDLKEASLICFGIKQKHISMSKQVFVSYKDTVFEPKSELKESIAGVQEILNNCTERLQLKNNKFKCYSLASKEDITEIFEIKKYNNFSCLYCKPIHLPSQEFDDLSLLPDPIPSKDHYTNFQQVYGTKTTEEHRPTCENCQKRCCIYSNKALTNDDLHDYQQALESYSYSCGAPIFSDDHYLYEVIFVRTQINCDSLIEILYYSSRKEENYSICYYCKNCDNLVTPP